MMGFSESAESNNTMATVLKLGKTGILVLAALLLASGCSSLRFPGVYRIDIGQGNILTQDMVDKLRIGMTPRQVEYVMGSPMIADNFNPNRWDYLYHLETGKGISIRNHLILYFENERLARIDESLYQNPEELRNNLLKQLGVPIPPKVSDKAEETENKTEEESAEPTPSEATAT